MKPITTGEELKAIRQYFESELSKKDSEIDRLKGLIEEAWEDGADYEGNNSALGFEQFKQKHGL